jgi:protein-disulfide isomerase
MTKPIGLACIAALAAALSACQPATTSAPPSEADVKQMEQRVQEYFKKTVTLPEGIEMKLIDVAAAKIPGLLTANLQLSKGAQTQNVPLVLSRDGRYFVQGKLIDLTVDPEKAIMEKIALQNAPMRGNPNAAVTIVEFSDFQCPYCGRAYKTLEEQVMKEYGDKVRLVYKNLPLSIHQWAESGALAAACARQQKPEAFWRMYDFLFENQKDIRLENLKEKAEGVVRDAGLDVGTFDACYDSKAALDVVKADMQEAAAVGVRSTPTFFINGHKLEGAVPYETFKAALDAALGTPAATATASQPAEHAGSE